MTKTLEHIEQRRHTSLLMLLPILSAACFLSLWSTADLPIAHVWQQHIWSVSGSLFLGLFFTALFKKELSRLLSWSSLFVISGVLITRLFQLFTGPLIQDPNASMFVGLFAYIPLQYIFCYLLLPARDATIASVSIWIVFAAVSLSFAIPELENGREGARHIVLLMTLGQPIVIVLLAALPKYEAALQRTHEELTASERSRKDYEKQASTDALTGLLNRRGYDDKLYEVWSTSSSKGTLCLLVMIDIDYFKYYNDKLGHPEGDRCLKAIAHSLARLAIRQGLAAARVGGEEFALIGHVQTAEQGANIAEQANAIIHSLQILHPNPTIAGTYVTASAGFAIQATRQGDIRTLVANADAALYQAKHSGRNCIKAASSQAA